MRAGRFGWAGTGAAALLPAALLLAALGWGLAHPAHPAGTQVVGQPAPELVLNALGGGDLRLSQFRGRPVVLNFWASWCSSCQQEDAALQQAARARSGSVQFLGVDIQDSQSAATAYEVRAQHPYPVGPAGGAAAAYGVTAPPETFFIDARGTVVARFAGPLDGTLIDRYLKLVGM